MNIRLNDNLRILKKATCLIVFIANICWLLGKIQICVACTEVWQHACHWVAETWKVISEHSYVAELSAWLYVSGCSPMYESSGVPCRQMGLCPVALKDFWQDAFRHTAGGLGYASGSANYFSSFCVLKFDVGITEITPIQHCLSRQFGI